jgi:hypothetical protein
MKLSGQDAFDKVLEAAMDAHVNVREATRRQHEAEQRARDATSAATDAHALQHEAETERAKLQAEHSEALPKLAELWQAAKAVSDFWTSNPASASRLVAATGPLMERLHNALEAAANYCDDIPF